MRQLGDRHENDVGDFPWLAAVVLPFLVVAYLLLTALAEVRWLAGH